MAAHSSILAWRMPMDGGAWRNAVPSMGSQRQQVSTAQQLPARGRNARTSLTVASRGQCSTRNNQNWLKETCLREGTGEEEEQEVQPTQTRGSLLFSFPSTHSIFSPAAMSPSSG